MLFHPDTNQVPIPKADIKDEQPIGDEAIAVAEVNIEKIADSRIDSTADSDAEDDEIVSSALRPTHISDEDMEAKSANIEEIILVDTKCLSLDLNHGRIKQIEGLEPLECIERFVLLHILMVLTILMH